LQSSGSGFSAFRSPKFNKLKTKNMHADLKGALEQINRSYKAFEHRGQKMSKEQVRKVLKYGIDKGYKTTAELKDEEVDKILNLQ
jgi:hypothetical protein